MWLIYAIIGDFFKTSTSLLRKKISKDISGDVYIWVNATIFIVILAPIILLSDSQIINLFKDHWASLLGIGATTVAALFLAIEA